MQSQLPTVLSVALPTGQTVHFTKEDLLYKFSDLCDAQPNGVVLYDGKHNHVLPTYPHEPGAIRQYILSQLAAVMSPDNPNHHFLEVDYSLLSAPPSVIAYEAFTQKKTIPEPIATKTSFAKTSLYYAGCIIGTFLVTRHIYIKHH